VLDELAVELLGFDEVSWLTLLDTLDSSDDCDDKSLSEDEHPAENTTSDKTSKNNIIFFNLVLSL